MGGVSGSYILTAFNLSIQVTSDGVKTASQLLNDLYTSLKTKWQSISSNQRLEITGLMAPNASEMNPNRCSWFFANNTSDQTIRFNSSLVNTPNTELRTSAIELANNASHFYFLRKGDNRDSFTNFDSYVWSSSEVVFCVRYQIWTQI